MLRLPTALMVLATLASTAVPAAAQQTVVLRNDAVEATVLADYPLVREYRRIDAGAVFPGAEPDARWTIRVIRPDRTIATIPADGVTVRPGEGSDARRSYAFDCRLDGRPAVTFRATIELDGDQVVHRIDDIAPADGFRLREVDFGRAIRVGLPAAAPEPAVCGGNLDRDRDAYFLEDPTARARAERAIDMIMLLQRGAVAAGYNNLVVSPWRFASRGAADGVAAEFWCPPFVHTVWAGTGERYVTGTVTEAFVGRIGVLGDRGGDGAVDWRDGAGFIRDQLPGGVPLFQDWLRYEAGVDFGTDLDVIRRMYHFTDGRRRLCIHAGWQYWGWDSEYPAYMEPSDERGGRAALYELMREAPKYRAIVTLIHNWDDAYRHSPSWDEAIVMRNEDQSLWEVTAWAGGRSFRTGHVKMVQSGWADRVLDGLVAQGARMRTFSDVLSTSGERVDYDRDMPADALASLVLGKFAILDLARQRGLVTGSESVTWPYVGRICAAHSMPLGISTRESEVPLGPFVLHGKLAYQGSALRPESYLAGTDNNVGWNGDAIYLWHLVLAQYADRPMTNYTREDGVFRSEFGGPETFVEWNRPAGALRVVVDGRLVFNGEASFVPKETPDVFLAYSRAGDAAHRFPKPAGWTDPSKLLVHRLSDGPEQAVNARTFVELDGEEIVLRLSAGTPYRICYGQEAYAADRRLRETPLEPPTITWPLDEVIETSNAAARPDWIRMTTRTEPEGATLVVGAGAKFPALEASRRHAASIVARKIAWSVRQTYVYRSRDYENELGIRAGDMGFDNWNLGIDEPLERYTVEYLESRPDARWYWEKLQDNDPQLDAPRVVYKAFVAIELTAEELHDLYVLALRNQLEAARAALAAGEGSAEQLRNRVRLWEHILSREPQREPLPLRRPN